METLKKLQKLDSINENYENEDRTESDKETFIQEKMKIIS